ncbi:MAG: hypothetical protein M3R52_12655 [Acidobacteriota bacterium]|nr:hypothetical protein [Acidobacteriota bacterium]
MAGTCDGNWLKSEINGVDDGTIEIKEKAGGFLTGKHRKSDRELVGKCNDGASPHITFVRLDDNGCFYIYDGDIERVTIPVEKLVITNGSVTEICGPFHPKREPKKPKLDDDWTAEKPT